MSRAIRALALVALTRASRRRTDRPGRRKLKVQGAGKTVLKLSPGATDALESLGVAASPIGPRPAVAARA